MSHPTLTHFFFVFFISLFVIMSASTQSTSAHDACTNMAEVENPYQNLFFDNDFNYLLDPCLAQNDPRTEFAKFTDQTKRLSLGGKTLLDLGGEFRLRYHDENGKALSRIDGLDNSFLLTRLRVYANLEIGDNVRFYAETIDARSVWGELPPSGGEVDHFDLINGFGEVRGDVGNGAGYFRAGRQQIQLGSQRIISPLSWSNVRRAFDGFRGNYTSADWTIDGWITRPRNVKARTFNDTNGSQAFIGGYVTYKGVDEHTYDFYLLHFEENQNNLINFSLRTAGGRGQASIGDFTWEFEGAYQFGSHDVEGSQRAGMFVLGGKYDLSDHLPGKPNIALYYEWASGDGNPLDGRRRTFHQLFPLGHGNFGFIDFVGRQNIADWNLRVNFEPVDKVEIEITGHMFNLVKARDALYNSGGRAIRHDVTGLSGKDVGEELDLTVSFPIIQRVDTKIGYSRFWGGSFVDNTNPVGVSGDASFFYLQVQALF